MNRPAPSFLPIDWLVLIALVTGAVWSIRMIGWLLKLLLTLFDAAFFPGAM